MLWSKCRSLWSPDVPQRSTVVKPSDAGVDIVPARTRPNPETSDTNRDPNATFRKVEAKWSGRNRLANVEWQLRSPLRNSG